jgi:hypothetical protein
MDGTELRVTVGMHVTVEIKESRMTERLEFDLVPDKQSDFSAGLMSERAPLAQAIQGRQTGETVQYLSPAAVTQTVTVLSIEVSKRELERRVSDREEVLGEVMDRIARRESKQIALTAELHYGSIDPDGIKDE